FKTSIPAYLCPTNPLRPGSGVDTAGYGYTDYMPIAYTDLNDGDYTAETTATSDCTTYARLGITLPLAQDAPAGAGYKNANTTNRRSPSALALGTVGSNFAKSADGLVTYTFPWTTTSGNTSTVTFTDSTAGTPNVISVPTGRDGPQQGSITDGLSKTIFIIEDVGRVEGLGTPKYLDPLGNGTTDTRKAWRWAEPDTANGVSGPQGALLTNKFTLINNSK